MDIKAIYKGSKAVLLVLSAATLAAISGTSSAQTNDRSANVRNPNQMQLPATPRKPSLPRAARSSRQRGDATASFPNEYRSIDGSGNNLSYSDWGQVDIDFLRMADADYTDGIGEMSGQDRPSARLISNVVVAMDNINPPQGPAITDMVWQWGQFLDHDIDLTPEIHPAEGAAIPVPQGDQWFDPGVTGEQVIHFGRSSYESDDQGTRQQRNVISAYIDASNVYGSDAVRADELRSNDGSGKLKTSAGNLLPFNTAELENAPSSASNFFLAGDFRANEQVGLISMHTLFVREHNRLAEQLRADDPGATGEQIYQTARAMVGAQMQVITYKEFLPLLIGKRALPRYRGYKEHVNASISNEFATAAYRFGHTMLSPQILRVDATGNETAAGHLPLRRAFFVPNEVVNNGIDDVLRGLASQKAQKIDTQLVDDVRNLLFGPPGSGGLDLASLNIQRGRDHGLASYADTRVAMGLNPVTSFADITPDVDLQAKLQQAYGTVDKVDLWVGGLAEPAVRGGLLGETFAAIIADQFTRLRDGDRFWYQGYLPRQMVRWANRQTLAKVIKRNTNIGNELQNRVFKYAGGGSNSAAKPSLPTRPTLPGRPNLPRGR